jgi:nitrate reductase gamma subunit
MKWYIILTYLSLVVCLLSCAYHLIKIIRQGAPQDYSRSAGDVSSAISYSFTKAMNPMKKESAYLHLPTYTAGIVFHIGTFLSILLFILILSNIAIPQVLSIIASIYLLVSFSAGIGIFIKRLLSKNLKEISSPDDYISNLLVTAFQLVTIVYLFEPNAIYYIVVSLLLLYLPLGKLKHTLYFFAARYHLGLFYGWRGTWPPKEI